MRKKTARLQDSPAGLQDSPAGLQDSPGRTTRLPGPDYKTPWANIEHTGPTRHLIKNKGCRRPSLKKTRVPGPNYKSPWAELQDKVPNKCKHRAEEQQITPYQPLTSATIGQTFVIIAATAVNKCNNPVSNLINITRATNKCNIRSEV